jgi:hypothetical protein
MLLDQIADLDRLVKERYGVLVAEFDGYERDLLPDFREYDGVRLSKVGITCTPDGVLKAKTYGEGEEPPSLGPEDADALRPFGEPAGDLAGLAQDLVVCLIESMRAQIAEVANGRPPTICFLANYEMPSVHWKTPPDVAEEHGRGVIKMRHVFAVRP